MAQQLDLFGFAAPKTPPPPAANDAPPPAPVAPEADARQAWLFDGPHSHRNDAAQALLALDATALRCAATDAQQRYPSWSPPTSWLSWSEGLAALGTAQMPAQELVERSRALWNPQHAARLFQGLSEAMLSDVRRAALCRAADALLALEGTGAQLFDGRPAGYLYLLAGCPERAAASLTQARQLAPESGTLLGYLGESLWRSQRTGEAVETYRDAYLLAPSEVNDGELTCRPILDLLDLADELELPGEAGAWVPVLADLADVVRLPPQCAVLPAVAGPGRRCATLLHRCRQTRDPAERLDAKREMLRLGPPLRRLVQKLSV